MDTIAQLLQTLADFVERFRLPMLIVVPVIAVLLIGLMLRWLGARQAGVSSPKGKPAPAVEGNSEHRSPAGLAARLAPALRELFHRNEGNYAMPWYLVIGQPGAPSALRFTDDPESASLLPSSLSARVLPDESSTWRAYEKSILISPDAGRIKQEQAEGSGSCFGSLMQRVRDLRPERPLDGVILNFSARDLIEPERRSKCAEFTKLLLRQLDSENAFVLPVYVAVSDAENLPGFSSFSSQNRKQNDQIFGWSNPNKLATAYQSTWVREAFAAMADGVRRNQIEEVALAQSISDVDDFIALDVELSSLASGLGEVLDDVLDEALYQDGYYFRGIYLTGETDTGRHTFVRELFQEKIWPERNLASPTEVGLLSVNRFIRRYQIGMATAVVLLFGLLIFDGFRLRDQVESVHAAIREIDRIESDQSYGQIRAILAQMSQMNARRLIRIMMPLSWIDTVNEDVIRYIRVTQFGEIIYPTLACSLRQRVNRLTTEGPGTVGTSDDFSGWLDRVQALQSNWSLFTQLSRVQSAGEAEVLSDVARLISYLYDDDVAAGFFNRSDIYQRALEQVDYPSDQRAGYARRSCETPPYFGPLWVSIEAGVEPARRNVIDSTAAPEGLWDSLELLETQAGSAQNAPTNIGAEFLEFNQWLQTIQSDWIADPDQNPCTRLAERLEQVYDSASGINDIPIELRSGLSPAARNEVETSCRTEAVARLRALSFPYIGQAFAGSGESLQFSPTIDEFISTGSSVRALSFIERLPQPSEPRPARVVWNEAALSQALTIYREYERYAQENFDGQLTLPDQVPVDAGANFLLQKIVLERLRIAMDRLLRSAHQEIEAREAVSPVQAREAELERAAVNFDNVMQSLFEVLDVIERLQFGDIRQWFADTTRSHALQLVNTVEELSADPRPLYAPTVSLWNSPSYLGALFNINNENDLDDYLVGQRERTAYLAYNYARSPIEFLLNTAQPFGGEMANAYQWRRTLQELDKYERTDPASRLQVLEEFFRNTLQGSTADCPEDLSMPAADDLFSRSQRNVARLIESRCSQVESTDIAQEYQDIAERFDAQLAGKYPFGPLNGAPNQGVLTTVTVRDFFRYYATAGDGLAGRLQDAMQGDSRLRPALEFIQRLDRVADFFSGNLVSAMPDSDNLGVQVEFRVRQSDSPDSNQILDWRLENPGTSDPDQRVRYGDQNDEMLWYYDRPIQLAMQWAERSLKIPLAPTGSDVDYGVEQGDTVVFNEPGIQSVTQGYWALFRFMQRFQAPVDGRDPDSCEPASENSVVLGFPVRVGPRGGGDPEENASRFYIRLTLFDRGVDGQEKRLLSFPPFACLPSRAPQIPSR